jgi:hypothetical protein
MEFDSDYIPIRRQAEEQSCQVMVQREKLHH